MYMHILIKGKSERATVRSTIAFFPCMVNAARRETPYRKYNTGSVRSEQHRDNTATARSGYTNG